MRGITTFTYSDPLPNPIVAVEQEKQNVSVLSQIDKVNAAIRKESILATNSTDTLILSDDGVDLSNIALEYHTSTVIAVEYEMGPEPHKDVDAAFPQAENAVSNPSTDKNVPQAPTSQRTRGSQFRLGKARSARLASSTSRFYGMSGSSSHQASLRDAECAICLEIWKNGDVIKKLKCGHSYHENCLVLWLDEHDQCPMCRYKLQRPSFLSGFSH
ncbi:hypothetical protein BC830DRAFT_1097358 [Chytriomyces sp. MP71]|nr:hypothetical protein BC830DRAFT_1097358 [Chytriomyces sp. MP71]